MLVMSFCLFTMRHTHTHSLALCRLLDLIMRDVGKFPCPLTTFFLFLIYVYYVLMNKFGARGVGRKVPF